MGHVTYLEPDSSLNTERIMLWTNGIATTVDSGDFYLPPSINGKGDIYYLHDVFEIRRYSNGMVETIMSASNADFLSFNGKIAVNDSGNFLFDSATHDRTLRWHSWRRGAVEPLLGRGDEFDGKILDLIGIQSFNNAEQFAFWATFDPTVIKGVYLAVPVPEPTGIQFVVLATTCMMGRGARRH